MKIILTFLIFVSFQLYSQNGIKPFLKIGYFQSYTDRTALNELELGAGVQFNNYFSTQVNLRGSQNRLQQDPPMSFRFATLSIESSYRILGKKHMFSPVIAYDAGIEIANNGKDKFSSGFIYQPYYQEPYNQYNKGLYFGKAKILLSIQWKGFDILLGATYSTYFFKFNRLVQNGPLDYPATPNNNNKYLVTGTFVSKQFGFGFETSLKYTFPMKNRAAKKALE